MVDANVGRVMDELDAMSLMENTVILFLSDHGDLMGDHWLINKGPFLYRGLVRVPTIWRVPGGLSGTVVNDLVSAVDVCPTLLELAGIDAPEGVQGRSYAGALKGEHCKGRDSAYIEYDETYINDRLRQIRTRDWALTFYANNDYGLLFDLKNDPDELYNLWDSPAHQSVKRDLLIELLHESAQADDWLPPKKVHA